MNISSEINRRPVSRTFVAAIIFLFITTGESVAQITSKEESRSVIIESGVTGMIGYSHLNLDDRLRPFFTTHEYYTLGYDLFMKVGALIVVQPSFFGDHFQLVLDPTFSKFSWGNYEHQRIDSLESAVDIDMEALEFPLSLRFTWVPSSKSVQPYLRAGYSLSWIIDTEAEFKTKIYSRIDYTEFHSKEFPFADFQHAVFLSAGVEMNFEWVDYTIEFVCQKGEGIDRVSDADTFMSISNTTNFYLQLGVLF